MIDSLLVLGDSQTKSIYVEKHLGKVVELGNQLTYIRELVCCTVPAGGNRTKKTIS